MRDKLIKFRGTKSQEEMACHYGVSQQLWSKWERGITCPSPTKMLLIEKDSGIPMEKLFFDSFNNPMELKDVRHHSGHIRQTG